MKKKLWLTALATASAITLTLALGACELAESVRGEELPEEHMAEIWENAFAMEGEQFKNYKMTTKVQMIYSQTQTIVYHITSIIADGLECGKFSEKVYGEFPQSAQMEYFYDGENNYMKENGGEWENYGKEDMEYATLAKGSFWTLGSIGPSSFEFDAQQGQYVYVDPMGQKWTCKFKNEKVVEFSFLVEGTINQVTSITYGGQKVTIPAVLS